MYEKMGQLFFKSAMFAIVKISVVNPDLDFSTYLKINHEF